MMKLPDFLRKLCNHRILKIGHHFRRHLLIRICDNEEGYELNRRLEFVREFAEVDEIIEAERDNIIVFRHGDKYYAVLYEYNSYSGSNYEYLGEVKPEEKVIIVWKR